MEQILIAFKLYCSITAVLGEAYFKKYNVFQNFA